ncbi:distal tail protein Dit [Alkalihalobacillus trypoxylicola]|uniref:Phage tail protein n=1 Tax=Alkalihalobacillus trypoxylicola TaxID=519424 RepID=A0A162DNS2_9BACI|nr:distal tail protein Dit [Alkalihalobacillus trypoxylicola]KYG30419.1 hypothetical protein AZF04_19845 [Alkalihalobacillus trypoxylicola]
MRFNGIEKEYIRVMKELYRPPTPPIEYMVGEGFSGDRIRKRSFLGMDLQVPIVLTKNPESIKEDLSNWLVHEQPKPLVFKDHPERYYLAIYRGMDLNEDYQFAKGTVTFYLPEGYRFGPHQEIEIGGQNIGYKVLGQASMPWTSQTIFKEDTSEFFIEKNQSEKLICHYHFKENDRLEINSIKRQVLVNGENKPYILSIHSNWFELTPGLNHLVANHRTFLNYTERYF